MGEYFLKVCVQKYGGSSLANLEKLNSVAMHVKATLSSFDRVVVVVSAMGGYYR